MVEKQPLNISGSPLFIKCKHFLTCLFIIGKERDCQTIHSTLLQFSRPTKYRDLLCFKENKHLDVLRSDPSKNVKTFSEQYLVSEYARMGVPNIYWKLTDINSNYDICDTYPTKLYVPASATDQQLKGSASFRSRGRLPVLSYLHPNGASITRCAQPLGGFNGRSIEDEQFFQLILFTNENSKKMYVIDTRPKINALANKAQGKGFENENNYTNINFHFIGIENIHVMRSSQQKLIECTDVAYTGSFLIGLEKSEWIKHIQAIMETSLFIANAVDIEKTSVLVHCSDGWDRTAQTCAFASLILDPYYRSLHGFQVLIEKEWLTFGHKFTHRCGHLYENENSLKEVSPIFTQFLECVWQLMQQYPCAFEFNERYLIRLNEHVYSCQFGTFVGNCEKERLELKIAENTVSFWDYVQHRINDFLNPLYVANSPYASQVLRPDCRIQILKYWRSLYNRFDPNIMPKENYLDALAALNNHTFCLNEYNKLLEKRCSQMRTLFMKNKSETENTDSGDQEKLNEDLENVKLSNEETEETSSKNSNSSKSDSKLDLKMLDLDFSSMELNWKSTRNNCICSYSSFDTSCAKIHCSRCGEIYCERCSESGKQICINQISTKLVFTCQNCLKKFSLE